MLQARRELDFREKPLRPERCRELGAKHLHGDLSVVPHVIGKIDGRRAPGTEFALEAVAIRERSEDTDERRQGPR